MWMNEWNEWMNEWMNEYNEYDMMIYESMNNMIWMNDYMDWIYEWWIESIIDWINDDGCMNIWINGWINDVWHMYIWCGVYEYEWINK